MVEDELYDEPQYIRPQEAERLHGMLTDTTAAPGVSNLQRLRCIGNGWDVIVTSLLLAQSNISRIRDANHSHAHACGTNSSHSVNALSTFLVEYMDKHGSAATADLMCAMPSELSALSYKLLTNHCAFGADGEYSILDSGSSKHLSNQTCVTDSESRSILTGFDGSTQWTEGHGYLPINIHDEYTRKVVPFDIGDVDLLSHSLVSSILSLGK
jgi:hypothetical protein